MFSRYICGLVCASALYASSSEKLSLSQIIEERGIPVTFSAKGSFIGAGFQYDLKQNLVLETMHPYNNGTSNSKDTVETHIKLRTISGADRSIVSTIEVIDGDNNGTYQPYVDGIILRKTGEDYKILADPVESKRIFDEAHSLVKELLQLDPVREVLQKNKSDYKKEKAAPGQQLSYLSAPRMSFF